MIWLKTLVWPLVLVTPISIANTGDSGYTSEQICLAKNMYWEIRAKDYISMINVSQTVLNRVEDGRYPDNVCDVIRHYKQEILTLNKCQFSWYCDGKSDLPLIGEIDVYAFALSIAGMMHSLDCQKQRCVADEMNGPTVYHSVHISPPNNWNMSELIKVNDDGFHIFYLEK